MAGVKAADRCPGLLRPHPAEDGALIRLRFPGGQTTADTLSALSGLARTYGHPDLQLTSRAGLQLRGLPDRLPRELTEAVLALGLVPSAPHERVRNIVASPLTGVSGGKADLRGLIHDLDRAILDEPSLADLPGRFLFVLDDGRGDVVGRAFDLGYRAFDGLSGVVLVGGGELGFPVPARQAVDILIRLACDFAVARRASGAWHVRELPTWMATVPGLGPVGDHVADPTPLALGDVAGAASVVVPLALLTPDQADVVVRVAPGPLAITPWRGLVLPGAAPGLAALTATGLVATAGSAWSSISACVGGPSCGQAAGSTRALALELVQRGDIGRRTHVSGCERRCGAPADDHRDVVMRASHGAFH
jgi:precorrin-3B synthase